MLEGMWEGRVGCIHEPGETVEERFRDVGRPAVAGYEGEGGDDEEYEDGCVEYVGHFVFLSPRNRSNVMSSYRSICT